MIKKIINIFFINKKDSYNKNGNTDMDNNIFCCN